MNFFVTVVINGQQKTFSNYELVYDGEYYCISKEYFGLEYDLKLPLMIEAGKWFIKSINAELFNDQDGDKTKSFYELFKDSSFSRKNISIITMYETQIIKEKEIFNKDIFSVFDKIWNLHYSLLFNFVDDETLKSDLYEIHSQSLIVGRSSSCDISYGFKNLIMDEHIRFAELNSSTPIAEKIASGNGYVSGDFYVNGKKTDKAKLKYGDRVTLRDIIIVYLGNYLLIRGTNVKVKVASLKKIKSFNTKIQQKNIEDSEIIYINRTPRIIEELDENELALELPPAPMVTKKMPAILSIGPSLTMSMAMLVSLGVSIGNVMNGGSSTSLITSGALAFSMLLGAILWPLLSRRYQKKQEEKNEIIRKQKYDNYLEKKAIELHSKSNYNMRIIAHEMFAEPKELLETFVKRDKLEKYIYSKKYGDDDFLEVRVGNGQISNPFRINIPENTFSLIDDPLKDKVYNLATQFQNLDNMPITLSLSKNRIVGIQTGDKDFIQLLRTVIISLTYYHAYDEVKTVFIYNETDKNDFEWIRKINHATSDSGEIRYFATNKEEVHNLFSVLSEIVELRNDSTQKKIPHYVIFIFDSRLVDGEPIINHILGCDKDYGVTLCYLCDRKLLPKECEVIIEANDNNYTLYKRNTKKGIPFVCDKLNDQLWETFLERMESCRLKLSSIDSNVPEKLSFMDMYSVGRVEQLNISKRWKEHLPYKSLGVPIGVKAGGEVLSLDMHESYHGPHGLAAGMTGSGKSEFLQTLILSLALNFSPDNVAFVLIDFKGGGMANSFRDLPHIAGMMTNLSGGELNRAIVTIKAETERRQRKFKEVSVNHIDKYQKIYEKNKDSMDPLPHLIIIADEFAELKSQQPEFMKDLIEIARIGRSLGIHLLLATQKPSGVVDDQIWGNSKFRVCLKVLEKQDSNEMIRRPDAALIKLPGRCYMQVGYDEVFDYFQSGYSGVPYIPRDNHSDSSDNVVSLIDSCGMILKSKEIEVQVKDKNYTQLNAVIDEIKKTALMEGYHQHRLWLDPLPYIISLDGLMKRCNPCFENGWRKNIGYSAVIGMLDYPAEQKQMSLEVNYLKGNCGIFGISGCGKSTLLQSLIYSTCMKYAPDRINFHIFDFSSRVMGAFVDMPHVQGIAFSDDEEKVKTTIDNLISELERRNKLFGAKGVSGLEAYNAIAEQQLPMIVLVIDNFLIVPERFNSQIDKLVRLARYGNAYGLNLVVTALNKTSVYGRIADCLQNNFVLKVNDRLMYREILHTAVNIDIDEVPGRGMTNINKKALEFQVAIINGNADDAERVKAIRDISFKMKKIAIRDNLISSTILTEQPINQVAEENIVEEQIVLSNASNADGDCIVFDHQVNDLSLLLLGKQDNKYFYFDIQKNRTLFIMGDNHKQNVEILKNQIKQLNNGKNNIFLFDTNNEFENLGLNTYSFKNDSVTTGVANLFATVKANSADNVVVIIPDLPTFFELLDDKSGERLGTLTGASGKKRALFIVEGIHKEIAKLTGAEIGANLRKDTSARGLYVNAFLEGDLIFGMISSKNSFGSISLNKKQGFIVSSNSCTLCNLEGLK